MSQTQREIVVGDTTHPYTIRRSRRAKHLLLHVSLEKGIEVVVPWTIPYRQGEQFLHSRRPWLSKQLQQVEHKRAQIPTRKLTTGELLPLFGEEVELHVESADGRRSRARRTSRRLDVSLASNADIQAVLERWYRNEARTFFTDRSRYLGSQLGVSMTGVRITAARTQWGSCSTSGMLSFAWRLALAPVLVADYVTAHEVAHLKYRGHGPRFWHTVETLHPDRKVAQKWLKKAGHTLVLARS